MKKFTLAHLGFCVILAILFCQHYLQIINIPLIFTTIFSAFLFIIANKDEGLLYLIMLIPFSNGVHITQIAFFYVVITVFKKRDLLFNKWVMLSFLLIIILQLIAGLRCGDDISTAVYLFAMMGCVVLWSFTKFDKEVCHAVLSHYVFALTIMSVFMVLLTFKFAPLSKILAGEVRFGEALFLPEGIFHTGANGLGMNCLFAIAIICVLLHRKAIKVSFAIFSILILIVMGFLTQSRAFVLGLIFVVFYVLFLISKNIIDTIKIVSLIVLVFIAMMTTMHFLAPNVLSSLYSRFLESDITSGRDVIFSEYFDALNHDPISLLFGAGLQSYPTILGSAVNNQSAHNATQEIILSWGITGLLSVLVFFISIFQARGFGKFHGKKALTLFPFLTMLLMVQSTRIFSTYNSILLIGVSLFCVCSQENDKTSIGVL